MKCDLKDCRHNSNGICCNLSYVDCPYHRAIVSNKVKQDVENWPDYKKKAYNEMFVSAHSKKLKIDKISITDIDKIESMLREHNVYIISSIGGKGNHVGRLKGFSLDADGNLIIETDIDKKSSTG